MIIQGFKNLVEEIRVEKGGEPHPDGPSFLKNLRLLQTFHESDLPRDESSNKTCLAMGSNYLAVFNNFGRVLRYNNEGNKIDENLCKGLAGTLTLDTFALIEDYLYSLGYFKGFLLRSYNLRNKSEDKEKSYLSVPCQSDHYQCYRDFSQEKLRVAFLGKALVYISTLKVFVFEVDGKGGVRRTTRLVKPTNLRKNYCRIRGDVANYYENNTILELLIAGKDQDKIVFFSKCGLVGVYDYNLELRKLKGLFEYQAKFQSEYRHEEFGVAAVSPTDPETFAVLVNSGGLTSKIMMFKLSTSGISQIASLDCFSELLGKINAFKFFGRIFGEDGRFLMMLAVDQENKKERTRVFYFDKASRELGLARKIESDLEAGRIEQAVEVSGRIYCSDDSGALISFELVGKRD